MFDTIFNNNKPTKHLNSLTIKNFRILQDVEINKLGHVNLIVGHNNSGKSTVLEALELLASGFDKQVLQTIIHNRNVNRHIFNKSLKSDEISIVKLCNTFDKDSKEQLYIGNEDFYQKVEIYNKEQKSMIEKSILLFDVKKFYEEKRLQSSENELYYSYFKDIVCGVELLLVGNSATFHNEFVDTNVLDINQLAQEWENIALTEEEDFVIEILQTIEPTIMGLAFLSENEIKTPYVRLKNSKNRIPLHEMGDGVIRLLQIILKVIHARDGFLFIDKFENGLHYSVQPKVWRLIFDLAHKFNIQVFATTHSWDCIESFAHIAKEHEDLDGLLINMDRNEDNKVVATIFDKEQLYQISKDRIEMGQ